MICAQITSLAKQTRLQKLEEHMESVLGPPSPLPLILQTQEEVTASRADENQPSLPKVQQLVKAGRGNKGAKKKEDIEEEKEEEESIKFKKRKERGKGIVIMEKGDRGRKKRKEV